MKTFVLIGALALLAGTAHAVTNACDLTLDFFAEKSTSTPCAPDCNFPAGWTYTNQSAAGNTDRSNMYSIALDAHDMYGASALTLYFNPVYYTIGNAGKALTGTPGYDCLQASTGTTYVAPARRLMTAPTSPTWELTNPTTNTSSELVVQAKLNGGAYAAVSWQDPSYVFNVAFDDLVDGAVNNITISVTVKAGSALLTDTAGYASPSTVNAPTADQTITRVISVFKYRQQAAATMTFNNMCNTTNLVLSAAGIHPLPVPVLKNGLPVGSSYLFTPLVTVHGFKVLNIDGSLAARALDAAAEAAAENLTNFGNRFAVMPTTWPNDTLTIDVASNLQEGYYNFNATVSLLSDNYYLNNLNGLNQINQQDVPAVTGKWESEKSMDVVMFVGVQRSKTYLSAITYSVNGVSNANGAKLGDTLMFSWTFRGIGTAECAHDGQALPAGTACKSGLSLQALDTKTGSHTFTVTFTDVCGVQKVATFTYTQTAVTTTATDLPVSLGGTTPDGTTPTGNSARGLGLGALTTGAALMAAAALL